MMNLYTVKKTKAFFTMCVAICFLFVCGVISTARAANYNFYGGSIPGLSDSVVNLMSAKGIKQSFVGKESLSGWGCQEQSFEFKRDNEAGKENGFSIGITIHLYKPKQDTGKRRKDSQFAAFRDFIFLAEDDRVHDGGVPYTEITLSDAYKKILWPQGSVTNKGVNPNWDKQAPKDSEGYTITPTDLSMLTFDGDIYRCFAYAGNVYVSMSISKNKNAIVPVTAKEIVDAVFSPLRGTVKTSSNLEKNVPDRSKTDADDASHIGVFEVVKGAPKIIRGGVKTTVRIGDSLRVGDKIITGDGEKVRIEFADGDLRIVASNSSIEFLEERKDLNLTSIQKIFGSVGEALSDGKSHQNTVVIGIKTSFESDKSAVTSAGTNNGILHLQHSRVRYDFSSAEDRVTVFEGRVDSIDPRTRESVTTTSGQQFILKAGRPLREAIITPMPQANAEDNARFQSDAIGKRPDASNLGTDALASGADRRQMEITYENGQKQQVYMQQSADNIIRIEFQGATTIAPPESKSDFGSTTPIANSLKGEVYFIPEGVSYLPNLDGQRAVSILYTSAINISPRRFESGFPGIPGRVEWFALRYTGDFYINRAGIYRFRTIADDGCWLVIDGKTVIDDRRGHAPSSASGEINLSQGMHQIRLDYFQGPRYDLALQLFVAQPGGSEKLFDMKDYSFSSSKSGQQPSVNQQTIDDLFNKARGLFR